MTQVPFTGRSTGKGHLRSCEVINSFYFLANKSRYDGAKDLRMVPNRSPDHDTLICTQRDLSRSNFDVDLSRSLILALAGHFS